MIIGSNTPQKTKYSIMIMNTLLNDSCKQYRTESHPRAIGKLKGKQMKNVKERNKI